MCVLHFHFIFLSAHQLVSYDTNFTFIKCSVFILSHCGTPGRLMKGLTVGLLFIMKCLLQRTTTYYIYSLLQIIVGLYIMITN